MTFYVVLRDRPFSFLCQFLTCSDFFLFFLSFSSFLNVVRVRRIEVSYLSMWICECNGTSAQGQLSFHVNVMEHLLKVNSFYSACQFLRTACSFTSCSVTLAACSMNHVLLTNNHVVYLMNIRNQSYDRL